MERERIVVEHSARNQRVDRFLAQLGRWGSRARVQKLIEAGQVSVDGQPVRARHLLRPGQTIEVRWQPVEEPLLLQAEPILLNVVYEDEFLMVIDKPAGLVVHPTPTHRGSTLVHALLYHWQGVRPGLDPLRPGIVHRLDKETSGLLVAAKDPDTLTALSRQFQQRTVRKTYLAAVWGVPCPHTATIDAAIARDPVHRKRMAVVRQGGRSARTTYRLLRWGAPISWLAVFPETGRTHQIRVHLASRGHPLVGDPLYGRPCRTPPGVLVSRQALHAAALEFVHPRTGAVLRFSSPLPEDLQPLWDWCTERPAAE